MTQIAFFVNTPAQAHFCRHIIQELKDKGAKVYLLVRDYGDTIELINEFGISYYNYSKPPSSKFLKILELPIDIIRAYNYLRNLQIDLVVGFGIIEAYTSQLLRSPSIIFNDTEPSVNSWSYAIQFKLFMPIISALITPSSFKENLGEKHIKVNSCKEVAYLNFKNFAPNDSIFELLGLHKGDRYTLIRFNAFDAIHDFKLKGFSLKEKVELVHRLEIYSSIFISSESELPDELKKYSLNIPKNRIHDVIYYASLLIADTGTMVTEGGILGTPSIIVHPSAYKYGIFEELEEKYKLIYRFTTPRYGIEKALELICQNNIKNDWENKRQRFLQEKVDIAQFMIWFLNNYPSSLNKIMKNPQIQDHFSDKSFL